MSECQSGISERIKNFTGSLTFVGLCIFVQFIIKSTNKIEQFSEFCTRRLFVAQHVSCVVPPIVHALISCLAMTSNATSFNLQCTQNQRLRVQLYAPDDGQYDARNM
jgi:hypothetical protein